MLLRESTEQDGKHLQREQTQTGVCRESCPKEKMFKLRYEEGCKRTGWKKRFHGEWLFLRHRTLRRSGQGGRSDESGSV